MKISSLALVAIVSCVTGGAQALLAPLPSAPVFQRSDTSLPSSLTRLSLASTEQQAEVVVDVVVVGAGIGGLSCAGLASKYGLDTICLEAHDTPGGVAHSFQRKGRGADVPFTFDSGPSLISGLSAKGTNPLRQVLDALDVADTIDWKTYDGWTVHDYADGQSLRLTTGDSGAWEEALESKAGLESRQAFERFRDEILSKGGLAEVSTYIPPFALRGSASAALSLSKYFLKFLRMGPKGSLLTGPFSKVMDQHDMHDPFVRKWFDYLAFALSGLDAAHTQAAAVSYMMLDLHKPGAVLDYPMGGMDALIQALVRGVEKHGGQVRLNSRVDRFLLEERDGDTECTGVVLADGKVIRARKGVVCNAPIWNMARLLRESVDENAHTAIQQSVAMVQSQANAMQMTGSFMHLHLGVPKEGLPEDLECHHSVLNFDKKITDEQNMVIISIPTVFDPSLAPEGYHVIHAYTAACDSYDEWETYTESDEETAGRATTRYSGDSSYQALKAEKVEVLWKAIECVIPDVRARARRKGSVCLAGTPLTHRRYNRRFRGTYGPAPAEGKDVWELPGCRTPVKHLLACGE